ncbi:hypothetical protein DRO47_02870 [Candidatus Bathyarchaeota archaeon]|nr:MAG: hypothetical protein DRO47_02870 [Candidatus Bathyarchaeota archaeon]
MSDDITSDPSTSYFPCYHLRITFQSPCPAFYYYHCPNCGYLVQPDWNYCPKCGYELCSSLVVYSWRMSLDC